MYMFIREQISHFLFAAVMLSVTIILSDLSEKLFYEKGLHILHFKKLQN